VEGNIARKKNCPGSPLRKCGTEKQDFLPQKGQQETLIKRFNLKYGEGRGGTTQKEKTIERIGKRKRM